MKINFSPINKIFAPKTAIRKEFSTLLQTLPNDRVEIKAPVLDTPNGFITKLKGTFSQEELNRLEILIPIFKRTKFNLTEIKGAIVRLIQISLQKCSFDKGKNTNEFIFDPQKTTPELKNSVNDSMVQLLAIKKIQNGSNPYASPAPLSTWYDNTTLGIMNPTVTPSRFIHPRDKAIQLTGTLTSKDLDKIRNQERKFKQLTDDKILNKKLKILQKLNQTFSKDEADFIGSFSNRELKEFKKLIIEYDALNNIQKSKGKSTKSIETKLFSTPIPEDLQTGDYINGFGLVINKITIKEKPAIIVFSNGSTCNQFRMYDLTTLKNASSESEESKSLISEIQFKHIKDHYLIKSFQNHYPKDYPDAGKIIGLQLMKLLAEKDCKPLEIEALAYAGSKHSPVNYYMHYGFTPVDYTKEEIEKLAKQNGGNFPYETPVKLVLNDFEGVRERIKRMEKIYFS